MKKIVLFLPNWIGDLVMATPAIRAVRQHWPQAKLIAVCKPYVAATFAGSPWFDQVILYDKKGAQDQRTWAVVKALRAEQIDAAIHFTNSFRTAAIAALGRVRTRVGFVRYGRRLLLTHRLQPVRDERGKLKPCPVIDDYNRLVMALGVPDPGYRMELHTTTTDEAAADGVWQQLGLGCNGRPVIGLNSSGAFGAAKLWPNEHFAALAQRLVDERGADVLVVCGPSERANARAIVAQANRPEVKSLADSPVSLGLTKACIKRLDLLITTDSGPRHFAAAFDRPVVTLFGPTFIEWTETYFDKAINLQKKVSCGPCQLRVCPLEHQCMRELTPDEVYANANELLSRPGNRIRLAG